MILSSFYVLRRELIRHRLRADCSFRRRDHHAGLDWITVVYVRIVEYDSAALSPTSFPDIAVQGIRSCMRMQNERLLRYLTARILNQVSAYLLQLSDFATHKVTGG